MKKEHFLDYYNQELEYLRKSGAIFAQKHPKIAQKLKIDDNLSPDPHTERLIESFAFLTSRINNKIDDNLSYMATRTLELLYPHLTRPIPAISIAEMKLSDNVLQTLDSINVDKGTKLIAYSDEKDINCNFQTVYPITLFPIILEKADIITNAEYEFEGNPNKHYLRFQFSSNNFEKANVDQILFHIKAQYGKALKIYKSIFLRNNPKIYYSYDQEKALVLGENSLKEVGFSEEETIMPRKYSSNYALHILQEYFLFPEKFLFFKLFNLDSIKKDSQNIDILIPINELDETIETSDFSITSTPIVNLYEATTDPITLDHTQINYLISTNHFNDEFSEIYSVESVYSVEEDTPIEPFFDLYHNIEEQQIYWISKREESKIYKGTDLYLSFVSKDFLPIENDELTVYAKVLATNRNLPSDIQKGYNLVCNENISCDSIKFLTHPRYYPYYFKSSNHIWKIVSILSINHMSYADEKHSISALNEILNIYSQTYRENKINIESIKTKECVERISQHVYDSYSRGIEISLGIETQKMESFLLASILRHYFAQNVSINSFVVLKFFENNEEVKRWKPILGNQSLI